MRIVVVFGLVLSLLVTGSLLLPKVLVAQTDGVISSPVAATQAATLAYWTPERMRSAIPRDMPTATKSAGQSLGTAATGSATLVDGNEPGGPAGKLRQVASAQRLSSPGTLGFPYPYPFTRYQIFPQNPGSSGFPIYNLYPYRANGKLFFKLGDTNYVCSGTSVTSGGGGNQSLVWTAGHCVHSGGPGGVWATNVVFVPGYRDGAAPFGAWVYYQLWSFTQWINLSNLKRDVGVAVMQRIAGNRLGNVVGTQGLAWNWTDQLHWNSFGYPAAAQAVWPNTAFNGMRQWTCESSFGRRVTEYEPGFSGPAPVAIGCDMTGGSSGGAWIMGFIDGVTTGWSVNFGYINGHNDWRWVVPAEPRAMHSPYYDGSIQTLWDAARVVVVP